MGKNCLRISLLLSGRNSKVAAKGFSRFKFVCLVLYFNRDSSFISEKYSIASKVEIQVSSLASLIKLNGSSFRGGMTIGCMAALFCLSLPEWYTIWDEKNIFSVPKNLR